MEMDDFKNIERLYNSYYQNQLKGRWICLQNIIPIIDSLKSIFRINRIGQSFLKRDIFSISIGNGKKKILIWSQMHGNESTGTKALFDLFNFLSETKSFSGIKHSILSNCTVVCIPILNPDGAEVYTRENAQKIDLNRDVINKKAVESVILQDLLRNTDPEYCFNLHDQRTIFSVGKDNKPATLSFLAPSEDEGRSLTSGRKQTMEIIVSINKLLQKFIPNQIGRYTDEFYPTATGDNFQKMGHNTILIESGHFQDDYQREKSRKYTFMALLKGIYTISNRPNNQDFNDYFSIFNNKKFYLDIIVKNITFKNKKVDIGIIFKEKLENSKIIFIPEIKKIQNLDDHDANTKISDLNLIFNNKKDMNEWVKNEFI
jgi:zinc carboxypeptidase